MKIARCKRQGMTLIELVVVLGLLAGLATYALVSVDSLSDRSRADVTDDRMEQIRYAIVGDGINPGRFVSDMGRLPRAVLDSNPDIEGEGLAELWEYVFGIEKGDASAYTYTPSLGTTDLADTITFKANYGWAGPYIFVNNGSLYDGFGNEFILYDSSDTAECGDSDEIYTIVTPGRNGVEDAGVPDDWADADSEIDLSYWIDCDLTIAVKVRSRTVSDEPVWETPKLIDSENVVQSITTADTYEIDDVCVDSSDRLLRCITPGTLNNTGSPVWSDSEPGATVTVTDSSSSIVIWEYLGDKSWGYPYMTEVKAVVFVPDTDASDGVKKIESSWSDTTNVVGISGLTPGMRYIFVYGGLLGSSNDYSNCWSSGLQTVELKPGSNFITVYLNQVLQ